MKKYIYTCLIIWIASGGWVAAQDQDADDPGIILPAVVLEIEDLSVEKVDAGLPEGSDIALPERELLITDDITLDIREIQFDLDLDGSGLQPDNSLRGTDQDKTQPGYTTGAGGPISVEAMLGAGNAGSIASRISFYKSGSLPRFKFLFNHDTVDGYAFMPAGTGYNRRYDELLASILFNVLDEQKLEMETTVNFKDNELGLQGQADYFSVINRYIMGNSSFKYKASDQFTFSADMGGELTSLILTGADTPVYAVQYPPTEILFAPGIISAFNWEAVNLGLAADYKYRTVAGTDAYNFHRLLIKTDLKIILPFWLDISGDVAFFRSNTVPLLFPFQLAFSGTPSRSFSFGIRGGYFLAENNIGNLLEEYSYLDLPAAVADNYGWFGAASVNLNLADNRLAVNLEGSMHWNKNYYYRGTAVDMQTNLFGLNSYTDIFSSDIKTGIRWTIVEEAKLDFVFESALLLTLTGLQADNQFRLGGDFKTKDGTLGAKLEAVLDVGTNFIPELPVLNSSLNYQIMDNVNLICALEDILSPLLSSPRAFAAPYIAPGVRGLLKIEIHF